MNADKINLTVMRLKQIFVACIHLNINFLWQAKRNLEVFGNPRKEWDLMSPTLPFTTILFLKNENLVKQINSKYIKPPEGGR